MGALLELFKDYPWMRYLVAFAILSGSFFRFAKFFSDLHKSKREKKDRCKEDLREALKKQVKYMPIMNAEIASFLKSGFTPKEIGKEMERLLKTTSGHSLVEIRSRVFRLERDLLRQMCLGKVRAWHEDRRLKRDVEKIRKKMTEKHPELFPIKQSHKEKLSED